MKSCTAPANLPNSGNPCIAGPWQEQKQGQALPIAASCLCWQFRCHQAWSVLQLVKVDQLSRRAEKATSLPCKICTFGSGSHVNANAPATLQRANLRHLASRPVSHTGFADHASQKELQLPQGSKAVGEPHRGCGPRTMRAGSGAVITQQLQMTRYRPQGHRR